MNTLTFNQLPPITDLTKMHKLWQNTKPVISIFCSATFSAMYGKEKSVRKTSSPNLERFNNLFKEWYLSSTTPP